MLQRKLPPRAFISVHLPPPSCLSNQHKNMIPFGKSFQKKILFSGLIHLPSHLAMPLPASTVWCLGFEWPVAVISQSVHALIGELKKLHWDNEEDKKSCCLLKSFRSLSYFPLSFVCSLLTRQKIWNCRCVLTFLAKESKFSSGDHFSRSTVLSPWVLYLVGLWEAIQNIQKIKYTKRTFTFSHCPN